MKKGFSIRLRQSWKGRRNYFQKFCTFFLKLLFCFTGIYYLCTRFSKGGLTWKKIVD